jgi:hypothetical protein
VVAGLARDDDIERCERMVLRQDHTLRFVDGLGPRRGDVDRRDRNPDIELMQDDHLSDLVARQQVRHDPHAGQLGPVLRKRVRHER